MLQIKRNDIMWIGANRVNRFAYHGIDGSAHHLERCAIILHGIVDTNESIGFARIEH